MGKDNFDCALNFAAYLGFPCVGKKKLWIKGTPVRLGCSWFFWENGLNDGLQKLISRADDQTN